VFVGATPGFFTTLGIDFVAGREFTARDTAESPGVAIVNTPFAAAHFPHQNPVGRRLTGMVNGVRRELEIVGVVGSVNADTLRGAPRPTVYVAYAQLTGAASTNVLVRASGSLTQISAALKRTLQPLAPVTPLDVLPLSEQVRASIARERLMAALAAAFGALALGLAALGIYGVLAYGVACRTREIGIRMALGARPRRVVGLILYSALVPVTAGLAIGAPAAWAAGRAVQSMLFGLKPTDAVAIAGAVAVLIAVSHAAAWLPARRAARVDPLIALRSE
jgi:predicted permease